MTSRFLYDFVKKNQITKSLFITYCIAISLFFYFLFFMIFGDKGVIKLIELKKEVSQKAQKKEDLQSRIKTRKSMIKGMKSESLDLDLLDEEARKTLGYVGKDEVVIYHEEKKEE